MVLLLLALLIAETLTGIYNNHDIADVGPFTELTPAPDHTPLDFYGALHRVHRAGELNQHAVAGRCALGAPLS